MITLSHYLTVAAIMLTLRKRTNTKYENPSWQVSVQAKDRIRIVKMASATKEAAP